MSFSQGRVIILDGTSTAGKTSLAKSLLESFKKSEIIFDIVAMDDFIVDVFELQKRKRLPQNEFIDLCNARVELMYKHVKDLAYSGKNVICDTTLICLQDYKSTLRWFNILFGLDIYLVLVYCSFDVLVERLISRNKEAILNNRPENTRLITVVLKQFKDMFRVGNSYADFYVDDICKKKIDYALCLAKDDIEKDFDFELFRRNILQNFDLHSKKSALLSTRIFYDLIVSSSKNNINFCTNLVKFNFDFFSKKNSFVKNIKFLNN